MRISDLMHGIRELDFVMPEFQREYVWTREQAKQLLVSLLRDYPTGSLLFWKTTNPPEIKNSAISPDKIGMTSVILDGQQRLTTLYLLTQDAIPPYYTPEDVENDPRNLYFDLAMGDLQFYQAQRMSKDPAWVPVTSCFQQPSPIQVFKIAQARQGENSDADMFSLAQAYQDNLTRLQNILLHDYPIETVPPTARIDEAIDVFDRVNSQGTKLSKAELALAHVAGKWPTSRKEMKDKSAELRAKGFDFDLTFMVRALTVVVRGRALFETIHDANLAELKEGWRRLVKILDHLLNILPSWAHIHSTDDLSTTNVLITPVAFLACTGGTFRNEQDIRHCVRWLYAGSTWARYTSQTDQRLEHDVVLVSQTSTPWQPLVDAIIDQRGRIDMKAADLEGRGTQHPFYRMAFILAKINGAVDWYTGDPLTTSHTTAWHSHHVFPQARLYGEGGLTVESHVDRQKVNEIANRGFLSAGSNTKLQDMLPMQALAEVESLFPGALHKQFIPLNRELWRLENFEAFLAARRTLIADAYNDVMLRLAGPHVVEERKPAAELILTGESGGLEFKSTLRWDVRKQQVNKDLQKVIAKTVAGFMNGEGGTLLIGVVDDGTVYGIEADMNSLGKQNLDGFELALIQTLTSYLGPELTLYYRVSFEEVSGHKICRVEIEPCQKAVYVHDETSTEFYVRSGNTTQPLDTEAAHEYIGMHWAA